MLMFLGRTAALLIFTAALFGCNTDKNSNKSSNLKWGLPGVVSTPLVYTAAVTLLTGTDTGENFGYVEFIRTPYGVIAEANLVYVDAGTYFIGISDRKDCRPDRKNYPPAHMESEIGVVKVGVDEVSRVSKILSEFQQSDAELIGKCIEVNLVATADPALVEDKKLGVVAVGAIGPREPSDLVF